MVDDSATGAGTLAGSIDYATGKATITSWVAAAPAFSLSTIKVEPGEPGQYYMHFRVAGAPIRAGSFYVQATDVNGRLISAIRL